MSSTAVIILVATLVLAVLASPAPRIYQPRVQLQPIGCRIGCTEGDFNCYIEPPNCKWGVFTDSCGFIDCKKAPGAVCSNNVYNDNKNKECAGELDCHCGLCSGCLRAVTIMGQSETCFTNNFCGRDLTRMRSFKESM